MKKLLLLSLFLAAALHLRAATGTIMPSPFQVVLDTNGDPVSGACIWTYTAGTTTPIATYRDVSLVTANANPIVANSAGRFTAFLTPGNSYKFVYENACTSPAHGSTILTADHISASPSSSANLDVVGTAGEALTAGQAVYLSDGSGSKAARQWFKADSANDYSSATPVVGMVPNDIDSASTGTIRLAGSMTGVTVVAATPYFIGTAGAITATGPANRRVIGVSDSTSSLIIGPGPSSSSLGSGTPSATTFLRGDFSWTAPAVVQVGYPATLTNVLNNTETAILTFDVPASDWADGDYIFVYWSQLDKANGLSGGVGTVTYKVNAGAGSQVTMGTPSRADDATEYGTEHFLILQRVGSTVWVNAAFPSALSANGNSAGAKTGTSTPTNFTSAFTVSLKATLSETNANFYIKPQAARVWRQKAQ